MSRVKRAKHISCLRFCEAEAPNSDICLTNGDDDRGSAGVLVS